MALSIGKLREMTGNRMRGGDMQQRTADGTRTPRRCSEDKASAHGTPALSTERMGAPRQQYLEEG